MPETAPPSDRVSVTEILARWEAAAAPLPAREVSLADALGAVLAEALITAEPLPHAPIALLDGWAVIAVETAGASPYTPAELSAARAVRAGDAVPPPFDAVASAEEASPTATDVPLAPGANLRRTGEDAPAGSPLLAAGTRLGARTLALAQTAGRRVLTVRRGRAVIGVDGDDDAPLVAMLRGFLAAHGFAPRVVGLAEAAAVAAEGVDLAVFLGGAAIGAGDPAWRAAFADARRPVFGRPALRPGEGVIAGLIGPSPALVLPSRLDEGLAAALALMLPLVDRATGATSDETVDLRRLTGKLASAVGYTELALLRSTPDGVGWAPLAIGSIGAAAIAGATHWTLLPPGSEGSDAGKPLAARPWPDGL
jgi:molybdopterin molybdotransferase